MIRRLYLVMALFIAAPGAGAAPYWVSYEGNDYPENEGWTRYTLYGEAQRWFDDGTFVLDSRASLGISDFYKMYRPGATDGDAGETFLMERRLCIDEVIRNYNITIGVFADLKWAVGFELHEAAIYGAFEPGDGASYAPGVYRGFRLLSADMRSYVLSIDGSDSIHGSFWASLAPSPVGWGDSVQGAASVSHWNSLRFGVVHEPQFGVLACLASLTRRTRT